MRDDGRMRRDRDGSEPEPAGDGSSGTLIMGLLAAPGLPADLARELADELPALLVGRASTGVRWLVPAVTDPLAGDARGGATAMVGAARERMLREGWDLSVCLTHLPLTVNRRPVVATASATHGVALISIPALGALQLKRRVCDAVLRLVDRLTGEGPDDDTDGAERRRRVGRRLAEIAAPVRGVDAADDDIDIRFVAAVVRGNLRLLAGMVRANRPWRLIARLSRALAAAVAAVAFAVVTSDIWRLADRLDWLRLAALTVLSLTTIVVLLIAAHRLWEHAHDERMREQVVLFNVATALTLSLGVLWLYLVLFVVSLIVAGVVVTPAALAQGLGHEGSWAEYAKLAWMASSLATVAGALGAGLESDEAVREAAYGYRSEDDTDLDLAVRETSG
ncbi:MAG: hypothetical protein QOF04_2280 [Solirubrobacteraceae bacterium]|nr:hypothetical protein [Solirubrobacteraceae bacterium]